jgi:hypothetical protein
MGAIGRVEEGFAIGVKERAIFVVRGIDGGAEVDGGTPFAIGKAPAHVNISAP